MFWKEGQRVWFYSLFQVNSLFQSEYFWLLSGHCDHKCNSSLDSLQLFRCCQENEVDLHLILPWGTLMGHWWGQPLDDTLCGRSGDIHWEAQRERWVPALLFHVSEHLLLSISRNEVLCWMVLWFAQDGAVHSWPPRRVLPGAAGEVMLSSLFPSNRNGPASQLQSTCFPRTCTGLAGFSGCESSFPKGSQHKFICAHHNFCRNLHPLGLPSCCPACSSLGTAGFGFFLSPILSLTHLPVKCTKTLNESGFLLVKDLCFCGSGNAVLNNMEARIYSRNNTYWEKDLLNLSKQIVN